MSSSAMAFWNLVRGKGARQCVGEIRDRASGPSRSGHDETIAVVGVLRYFSVCRCLEADPHHRVRAVIMAVIVWPLIVPVGIRPISGCNNYGRRRRYFRDHGRPCRRGVVTRGGAYLLCGKDHSIADSLLTQRD